MKVVRIPRLLKKVIKNFLKKHPRAVYHTTKNQVAYYFILRNGQFCMIWHGKSKLEE